MPFVLAGIPWLATAIGTFLSSTIAWFATYTTRRIAIIAATITVIVSLTLGFIAAIEGIISSLTYVAPDLTGVFAILPGNFSACIGAIVTARLLKWAYGWNVTLAQMKLF